MPKKIILTNNPASSNYDNNVPLGWNKWDAQEDWNGFDEDSPEDETTEDEKQENPIDNATDE